MKQQRPQHATRSTIEERAGIRTVRAWYSNGQLMRELVCKLNEKGNWVYHGKSRHWNSDGELIGTFRLVEGTGIFRNWYENGTLSSEITMVDGEMTGLQRAWDESGYLIGERFNHRGKPVSKKRYREIQQTNSDIPQYSDDAFESVTLKRKLRA